jgi:hypothetical protein
MTLLYSSHVMQLYRMVNKVFYVIFFYQSYRGRGKAGISYYSMWFSVMSPYANAFPSRFSNLSSLW